MNGVHDLGGGDGFGLVDPSREEPTFHSSWERRIFGMHVPYLLAGVNADRFRWEIERIPPAEYLSMRYYEHWLRAIEDGMVARRMIDRRELEQRAGRFLEHPDASLPERSDPAQTEKLLGALRSASSTRRDRDEPARFKVGDRVRVRNLNPAGHTRSPRYLRGRQGVIACAYGAFVFPDSNAAGEGENPQPLYNVRFDAGEVWGLVRDGAYEDHTIRCDLWESYLEAA